MPSFLLVIFLVQLGIHLLSTVGSSYFGEFLWAVYNKFPTPTSNTYAEVVRLRREAVRLQLDLKATSAQDQFAKWAKLQRQYDKTKADYDKRAGELRAFESTFKSVASAIRFLSATFLRFFLQWWYGKLPMFYLPKGWVPSYVEWVLAFPKAPSGSISIQIWFMACASVIAIAADGLAAMWALLSSSTGSEVPSKEKPSVVDAKTQKKEL